MTFSLSNCKTKIWKMDITINKNQLTPKIFITISLLTSIWQQVSQFMRYWFVVKKEMQTNISCMPDVAIINVPIFIIWGLWVTLITMLIVFLHYLFTEKFGKSTFSIFATGTIAWSFFYVLFWVGMAQMNLARWQFVPYILVLAWIETIITVFIGDKLFKKYSF
jgi:hypothetical protein